MRARGVRVRRAGGGELAEGEVGAGRMAEPEDDRRPRRARARRSRRRIWPVDRSLVSAGGTREPSTRCASSATARPADGRRLAEEARRRGAEVTLLAANLAVPTPFGVTVVDTPTAADLEREALARGDADVIVMAAAVADYRPAAPETEKRPKDGAPWTVELTPTTDVLAALGAGRTPSRSSSASPRTVRAPGSSERARSGRRRGPTSRLQRHQPLGHRVRHPRERGRARVQRSPSSTLRGRRRAAIAAAVLDEVERIIAER